jgi:uncharacterized protein (DUF433 family)
MNNEILARISLNPNVCFGKPTIRNKRYPVETMVDLMNAGMTIEELLIDYPDLDESDLLACLLYVKKSKENKVIQ